MHTYYLDRLVHHLDQVNEDRRNIVSIIREPLWTPNRSLNEASLCDIIIIYPHHAVPVELKSNVHQIHKGRKQIQQGFDYCEQVLGLQTSYGKFVWYEPEEKYFWRTIKNDFTRFNA